MGTKDETGTILLVGSSYIEYTMDIEWAEVMAMNKALESTEVTCKHLDNLNLPFFKIR
ncbi:hypothetical protein Syun_026065 [Stephania yunnanensis]|uniref:Uncharacterized protein n=1 Tax=Stephania yunnanensis TaxID=152371 RepID=A0AAP0EVH2_9MAGN